MTRRELFDKGIAALSALSFEQKVTGEKLKAQGPASVAHDESIGHSLAKYVDPLPIPSVIRPAPSQPAAIEMRVCRQKVHRDLPPTNLWGYNGLWPGPTIEVRKSEEVSIRWVNKLPRRHMLPIDTTIHGAEETLPAVRAVPHVHGAFVLPENDGYPDGWSTAHGETGRAYNPKPSQYSNHQPATTLWYHDHCIGITRLNVYAGLAGFFIIRDDAEESLRLPAGEYDIPLMIQDRQFRSDGSLLYPRVKNGTHPIWIQEFFGDAICVNGKVSPYLEVEPRKYRLRLLNASNARFYHLRLRPATNTGEPVDDDGDILKFHQIGSDGGLLPAPVALNFLLIAPGERFDVIIDFSTAPGKNFALINDAPAPYTMGGQIVPADVMLFKITKALANADASTLPETLAPFEPLKPDFSQVERVLAISEIERRSDGYVKIGLLGNARWHEPITETPKAGSTEIWTFANTTGDVHPIHLHLVQFQVLNRQAFDVPAYLTTGKLVFIGRPIAPEINERPANKDTIKTYPGYVTRIIQRFDLPPGANAVTGKEFLYVWHCHILEHEDNEMMRPYKVVV